MKNTLLKLLSVVMCFALVLSFAACSSDDGDIASKHDPKVNNIDLAGLNVEFKYSKDCSKPPIQLSRANTMLIEDNTFTNIKDENVFRFYSSYNAKSTKIINNTIDAAYLFQSDKDGAINNLKEFTFEGNTISKTTSLTMGHEANGPADAISPHNYTVDTTANTIK